ncbi:MAG: DUF167 domain-containing protein [Nitrososphaerota archaeon]|nr:DUF167 domain-containing protein [Nitrososphaerota archaeon]MDG6967682.1 DUF167 domain-containing protein [Nitrososphaerota archaeon]MDG6978167.1 DUF167 domain-containing protein [Nitrososphaerota archaeon]MDG7021035.1 DUF167 domain-containing protein [Nitrososphaerota archaeon]
MLVRVRVTPNAKRPRVVRANDGGYEVKVDEKAKEGRANKRLIEILAEHLGVPKSRLRLVSGARSRDKLVEVAGEAV